MIIITIIIMYSARQYTTMILVLSARFGVPICLYIHFVCWYLYVEYNEMNPFPMDRFELFHPSSRALILKPTHRNSA